MSSIDNLAQAFESLKESHAANRLAHAYLIVGSPRGDARALAESVLRLLVCETTEKPCGECAACRQVTAREHPDLFWVEPENKSRQISIDQIRALNSSIGKSSFAGGWKAGVLIAADRLNDNAANAFLKTLEEPPDKCLLLLLTDSPQSLLPTLISRCQQIVLSRESGEGAGRWRDRLLDLLRRDAGDDLFASLMGASGLSVLLNEIQEEIESEIPEEDDPGTAEEDERGADARKEIRAARIRARLVEARQGLLRDVLLWHRDVLLCRMQIPSPPLHFPDETAVLHRHAARLTRKRAMDNVSAVEELSRKLERNMSSDLAIDLAWLQMAGRAVAPARG